MYEIGINLPSRHVQCWTIVIFAILVVGERVDLEFNAVALASTSASEVTAAVVVS